MEDSPLMLTNGGFSTYRPRDRIMLRKTGKLEDGVSVMENGEKYGKREGKMEVRGEVEKDLESLEAAFMRRWNHEKEGEIIELGEDVGEDEERWQRSLIGKLQTKRWFGEEEIKKELIRNWNISNKFEFMMVAEGICIITFTKEIDFIFVLENGPWDIHGEEEQLGCSESRNRGEWTEDKEDISMLTPEKGKSTLLKIQGDGVEGLDGFIAMDFSPNPGKMITCREIRSVEMTDASGGEKSKESFSRQGGYGYTFSACKKLLFNTFLDEKIFVQTLAQPSGLEHMDPKPLVINRSTVAQPLSTPLCNPIDPKKPKSKNHEIALSPKSPLFGSSPKILKRKLESEQNLVFSTSSFSPAQAQFPEARVQKCTYRGEKDGKWEDLTKVLENRKPKSQKGRPKSSYRFKPQGGQTDEEGTDRETQKNKDISSQTGDKRRKIIHSSTSTFNPSDLLFSGNFKRVWLKFLTETTMRRSYVGTSSRNERNERVFRGNVVAGSVNMKEEDKSSFNQEDLEVFD
ncbi:hypothetical protein FRX31_019647 [Thalictrum thalictroides]|uniref:DUF4283 domain-containing protein n=1 Tax=Thalictrum thalictroides TaxID=46969 RepID=A0A7J6W369_THATH|nr:hypothetical protein FRX31_019647 [Thalictrum thalictroides]